MADFLRCKDCKHDKGKCVGVSRRASHKNCFEPKVMTNAEWMRNMTEKEMVEFIGHNSLCDRVQGEAGNWCNNHNCTDCLREWLKQPAEG